MLKKIIALVLALTLCFVFVGCGDNTSDGGEDVEYTYTMLDKIITDNTLSVKPYSCIEIRYNL